MQRSGKELALGLTLMAAVGLGASWLSSHPRHPVARRSTEGDIRVDRVKPGMTRAETLQILGQPGACGPLPKGISYAEYGHDHLTWEGRPTLVFTSNERVLSVVGDEVERDSAPLFRIGDSADRVSATLKPVAAVVTGVRSEQIFKTDNGALHLTCDMDHVTRLILEKAAEPGP